MRLEADFLTVLCSTISFFCVQWSLHLNVGTIVLNFHKLEQNRNEDSVFQMVEALDYFKVSKKVPDDFELPYSVVLTGVFYKRSQTF